MRMIPASPVQSVLRAVAAAAQYLQQSAITRHVLRGGGNGLAGKRPFKRLSDR